MCIWTGNETTFSLWLYALCVGNANEKWLLQHDEERKANGNMNGSYGHVVMCRKLFVLFDRTDVRHLCFHFHIRFPLRIKFLRKYRSHTHTHTCPQCRHQHCEARPCNYDYRVRHIAFGLVYSSIGMMRQCIRPFQFF